MVATQDDRIKSNQQHHRKAIRMKEAAKEIFARAKAEFEFQSRLLKANEGLWKETWDSAKNPFEAWAQYKKDAPKRAPFVTAWIVARDFYESLPKPRIAA